jgi:hypothetical protein
MLKAIRISLLIKGPVLKAVITTRKTSIFTMKRGLKILARTGARFSTALFFASTRKAAATGAVNIPVTARWSPIRSHFHKVFDYIKKAVKGGYSQCCSSVSVFRVYVGPYSDRVFNCFDVAACRSSYKDEVFHKRLVSVLYG